MKKTDKTPQEGSITTGAISGSKKIYVSGKIHDIKVAMREITLTPTKHANGRLEENAPVTVYDTGGAYTDDNAVIDVPLGPLGHNSPQTSQSPAVSDNVATLTVLPLDKFTALPDNTTVLLYSPTFPATALSFVELPCTPTPDVPLPFSCVRILVSEPVAEIAGATPVFADVTVK